MKTEQRKRKSKATEGAVERPHLKNFNCGKAFTNPKPSASGFGFERKRKRSGSDALRLRRTKRSEVFSDDLYLEN